MSWFEDIAVGQTLPLGSHLFTAEEIIRFATAFDPQRFHTDPVAAEASHFGALAASGWHTVSIWMRLMAEEIRREADLAHAEGRSIGRYGPSPGFKQLRWPRPVFAGETIAYRSTFTAKRTLRSRSDWGLVEMLNEGLDPQDRLVLSFQGSVMMERRAPEEPEVSAPRTP